MSFSKPCLGGLLIRSILRGKIARALQHMCGFSCPNWDKISRLNICVCFDLSELLAAILLQLFSARSVWFVYYGLQFRHDDKGMQTWVPRVIDVTEWFCRSTHFVWSMASWSPCNIHTMESTQIVQCLLNWIPYVLPVCKRRSLSRWMGSTWQLPCFPTVDFGHGIISCSICDILQSLQCPQRSRLMRI